MRRPPIPSPASEDGAGGEYLESSYAVPPDTPAGADVHEIFALDLEHTIDGDADADADADAFGAAAAAGPRPPRRRAGRVAVTAWAFEGKDVEAPMVLSAGSAGHVHGAFLRVHRGGTIAAGRRVPAPTAPHSAGAGAGEGEDDVPPETPLAVRGRVQYRFRLPQTPPPAAPAPPAAPPANGTTTAPADSAAADTPATAPPTYVTVFCVGQIRGGQSAQVFAGDSMGRVHRLLVPYPVAATASHAEAQTQTQAQGGGGDVGDALGPSAGGGESPVLIVESLPPPPPAHPPTAGAGGPPETLEVVALATTGLVLAVAHPKLVRLVRVGAKGFEAPPMVCLLDSPLLGTGTAAPPPRSPHNVTHVAFDKKNPALLYVKLTSGDVVVFDSRTRRRGKGVTCAKLRVVPPFTEAANNTSPAAVGGALVPLRGHVAVAEGCNLLLYRAATSAAPIATHAHAPGAGGAGAMSPSTSLHLTLLARHSLLNCSYPPALSHACGAGLGPAADDPPAPPPAVEAAKSPKWWPFGGHKKERQPEVVRAPAGSGDTEARLDYVPAGCGSSVHVDSFAPLPPNRPGAFKVRLSSAYLAPI